MEDIYSDKKLIEYRNRNWKDAIQDFENKLPYIMTKIENIAEELGLDINDIYNIISNSKDNDLKGLFIAMRLAKDPKRQNVYETIFYDYLISKGRKLVKLPAGGKDSLILTKNDICRGKSDDDPDSTKSLDFYEKIGEKHYYYYHKYTKGEGGGQGNQYNDLKTFVRIAIKYYSRHDTDEYFIAVADGPYYNNQRKSTLEELAGEFINIRIFIVSWNEVLEKII